MMEEVALLGAQVDELINRRQQFFRAAAGDCEAPDACSCDPSTPWGEARAEKAGAFASEAYEFGSRRGLQEGGASFAEEQWPAIDAARPARAYDPLRYCDAAA